MTSTRLLQQFVKQAKPERLSRFVDSVRVKFKGGNGGDGCISMLHLFCNEFAGPDGGNGGNGGHIIIRANDRVKSLGGMARTYYGYQGERGKGKNLYGRNADHKFVEVPVGTLVCKTQDRSLAEHEIDPDLSDIVADLDQHGSMFIAARGGAGGRGNASYLSNQNRHPRVAQLGAKGEEKDYEIRLKIYAHVALIGLPSAGKSSLLRSLTNANVRVGDWDFTTLHPQVGVIQYEDTLEQVAISDLPGLIDDSHKNRGLGLRFLRHAQRCACVLFVIDLTRSPAKQMDTLTREMELFRKGMSWRPHIVVGNKVDEPNCEQGIEELKGYMAERRPNSSLLLVSSRRGDNLDELRLAIKRLYDEQQVKASDGLHDNLLW